MKSREVNILKIFRACVNDNKIINTRVFSPTTKQQTLECHSLSSPTESPQQQKQRPTSTTII